MTPYVISEALKYKNKKNSLRGSEQNTLCFPERYTAAVLSDFVDIWFVLIRVLPIDRRTGKFYTGYSLV